MQVKEYNVLKIFRVSGFDSNDHSIKLDAAG
jgi:hypothetical protein